MIWLYFVFGLLACGEDVPHIILKTGADLSYTNEMEDCGVVYYADSEEVDPYHYFADRGSAISRIRLWHTPAWYDTLNQGKRYSDLDDVIKSLRRSRDAGMDILLNYHLSDNWADPQRQEIPQAWQDIADDVNVLADSLYNYVYDVLDRLYVEGLVPEMVQVGNETNIEILKNITDTTDKTIDWERNAFLFKKGMRAVRDFSADKGEHIKIAMHLASPAELEELLESFLSYGVVDFDIIGISYYWAWHYPTTIAETGEIIRRTKARHPDKEVMIFETGYVWTDEYNDEAANIISETHPDYELASPANQLKWLEDLSETVAQNGGTAVLYWEPTWVSSPCYTQWGQGSHQEHATFFNFENKVIENGGIKWLGGQWAINEVAPDISIQTDAENDTYNIIKSEGAEVPALTDFLLFDQSGEELIHGRIENGDDKIELDLSLVDWPSGQCFLIIRGVEGFIYSQSVGQE